jgi:hypothetical protein
MKALMVQLGFLAASLVAILAMLLFSAANANAQNVQTKDCSTGCNFATDPYPATGTQPTSCLLVGTGAAPISKPVVDGTAITPPQAAGKTCWWPGVVLAPGSYSLTAIAVDGAGKQSAPSLPLSLTVSAPPVGAPTGLRAVGP